jgi:hypothetical protein
VQFFKDSWDSKNEYDREGVRSFLEKSVMSVQFAKLGTSAYVLHNAQTFRYLSSLDEIESLVYELFFEPAKKGRRSPDLPGEFRDPEISKMLDALVGNPKE